MVSDDRPNTYETTHFRTPGWVGAICFTLAPPAFFYEYWLTFYTTAMEDNPSIGPIMAIAFVLSFASVPLMIVGRRKRYSASPSVDPLPVIGRRAASRAGAVPPGRETL